MKSKKDQVELYKLIFTLNWEDPESDRIALKPSRDEVMMTITSGGCNTLSLLLQDPSVIYTIDINSSQSFIIEMKIISMKYLEYDEFIKFIGLRPSLNRLATYRSFRDKLSNDAIKFWNYNEKIIDKGFLINGRYEKFVKLVGGFVRMIEGNRRVSELFRFKELEDQREFCRKEWDTARTRFIFNTFFNKHILARRGLKADYFTFDDGSNSFSESFYKRFIRVISEVPASSNYFLSLYLRGCYEYPDSVPDYLCEKHFIFIKNRLDRVKIVTMDAKKWLAGMPDSSIDCFSLSNICELMSEEDTLRLFQEVYRTAKRDARICFRNLVIPREVPSVLQDRIVRDQEVTGKIFRQDRSFVYSRVAAYKLNK